MNRKTLTLILLSTLAFGLLSTIPVMAATDYKIVVYVKGGLVPGQFLEAAMEDISYVQWSVVLANLSDSDITDADMLILIQSEMEINFTTEEKEMIDTWFDESGKTLWVVGDSDYSDQHKRINTANEVLETVESKLRLENCEATDASSMADASYRVYGDSAMCSDDVKYLVNGVTKALFHGPGIVIGYVGGEYYDLIETSIDGIHLVMTTSENGTAVDEEPPAPEVHLGYKGYLPLMVLEQYSNGNLLYVTADSPFAHYTPMYKPELDNYDRYAVRNPQQGATLFANIVDNSIRAKTESSMMELDSIISSLESDKTVLTADKTALTADKTALTADKTALTAENTALTADKTQLESDVEAANGQVGTWQMYAGLAAILGIIIGVFVGPMIKK